ncbi:MAG: HAD family hydrolase [Lewinellaceae bacterium]|nr:HAD family hydrolase [Lewinellaceae bacterium]
MGTIELIIFDLDGTLVDSRYDLCDGVNYALEKLGLPQRISYDQLPPMLGSGLGAAQESKKTFVRDCVPKRLNLQVSSGAAQESIKNVREGLRPETAKPASL